MVFLIFTSIMKKFYTHKNKKYLLTGSVNVGKRLMENR